MSKKSTIVLIYHRHNLLDLINEFDRAESGVFGVPSLFCVRSYPKAQHFGCLSTQVMSTSY
jgi:hypothetical protein